MTSTLSSNVPDTATLIERAAAMRALLERNADSTDSLRRLADENVQALKDAGLCRLMVPARFGGYQTSVRTYIDVMAEVGRGCGSTSWVASLINVCAWLASLFPERAQADIWGNESRCLDRRIAGAQRYDGASRWRLARHGPVAVGVRLDARAVGGLRHSHEERAGRDGEPRPLAHADRRADHRRHLVHGRHEGHRQQHDRGQGRLRAGASLPAVSTGVRRHVSHRAHRRSRLSRRVRADHGADSRALAAWRGPVRARACDRSIEDARESRTRTSRRRPNHPDSRCRSPRRR